MTREILVSQSQWLHMFSIPANSLIIGKVPKSDRRLPGGYSIHCGYSPMLQKFIKRHMPNYHAVSSYRQVRLFGTLLHDPYLFHLNRRSVSGACAVGIFMAFVPLPIQMVLATAAAILFRVNLPLSVGLVWITNPITIAPIFYSAYLLGSRLLNVPPARRAEFAFSTPWEIAGQIWEPLLIGSLIFGNLGALIGYIVIRSLWHLHLIRHIRKRKGRVLEFQRKKDGQ